MSFNDSFYKQGKTHVDNMSVRSYMLAISGFTAIFIMASMVGASFSYNWTFSGNPWLLLLFMLACLVVSIGGGMLAQANDDPMISVLGGGICAIAMGLMIGPFVALYELGSVTQAFVLAAGVVLITGFIGAILPADLSAWGAPLFGLLLGAIFIQFGGIMLAAFGVDMELSFTILDWAVLILFCAIMVYDLNMARRLDRTLNNAIDVAVNVFLNFANIFIRILALMGQKK
jgi:FtsH-binding integral membrane protein